MIVNIISYPNNEINESFTLPDSLDSNELIKYLVVDVSEAPMDEFIEVSFNGQVITLVITEECRYTPYDVHFINKDGSQQVFTLFKKRTNNLSITNEEFESDRGQPLAGMHQYVKYNVQAREDFKLNTGFISEEINETITQLMLSSRLWIVENNIQTPINLKGKNIEYQTRQNNRLINYELSFEYAFNKINNI